LGAGAVLGVPAVRKEPTAIRTGLRLTHSRGAPVPEP
jgi:hypothetical protein